MKNTLIILAFILSSVCVIDASPKLLIYQTDGKVKEYEISEIQDIGFAENSGLHSLDLYQKDSSVKSYITQYIKSISFDSVKTDNPNFIINMFNNTSVRYTFSSLDSIVFKNHNTFNGIAYNSVEISIEGIVWEYTINRTEYWGGGYSESHNYSSQISSKFLSLTNKFYVGNPYPYEFFHCVQCSLNISDNILSFCTDYKYLNADQSGRTLQCNFSNITIYIDSSKKIIDKIQYRYYYQYTLSDVPGSSGATNDDQNESIILYSIPYVIDIDNNIVADFEITDLSKHLNTGYSSNYLSGNSGYSVSEDKNFSKCYFANGKSGRVKIKIKR